MDIDKYRYFFFDIDKTLWNWDSTIIGAEDLIDSLREVDKHVYFHTDNTLLSREEYARKLTDKGIPAEKEDILTSSYVAGEYMARNEKTSAYVIGESGIIEELDERDIEVSENTDTVVAGFDRNFNYRNVRKAMEIVNKGGETLLCSTETVFRNSSNVQPHQGPFNQAFRDLGKTRLVGKPGEVYKDVFQDYFSFFPDTSMFIGDRIDDMRTGNELGMTTVSVMSGDITREKLRESEDIEKPDYGLSNLARLKRKIL
jgi:Predicted sugar phosphatases of the HAD superfamily